MGNGKQENRGQTERFLIFLAADGSFSSCRAIDVPHHITQRGNARQFILASDAERICLSRSAAPSCPIHGLSVIGLSFDVEPRASGCGPA